MFLGPGGATVITLVRKVTPEKVLANIMHGGKVIDTSVDGVTRAAAERRAGQRRPAVN